MSKNQLTLADQSSEFLLYTAPDGAIKVEVLLGDETIWLTQKRMAELFGVGVSAVSKHLENIFETNELQRDATVSILETVQREGERDVKRRLEYYNLDAVISVGYRVNSAQATQFRIWATKTLREFIVKGFVLDDERLKQGKRLFGRDYFDELLELSNYPILSDKGKVGALEAKLKAEAEYEVFRVTQDREYVSDFDREIKRLEGRK